MDRRTPRAPGIRLALTAAVLVLAALPVLPTAGAQAGGLPSLAKVYPDDFDGRRAAWQPSSGPGNPEGNQWSTFVDGTHGGWFASRAGGYDNEADVRLTSPPITMPPGFLSRSVQVTLRGSSEPGFDILYLEWSPTAGAADAGWMQLGSWTGEDLAESYALREVTSGAFTDQSGTFHLRLRFTADDLCDSDPGSEPASVDPQARPLTYAGRPFDESKLVAGPTYGGAQFDPTLLAPGDLMYDGQPFDPEAVSATVTYDGEEFVPTDVTPGNPPMYQGEPFDPTALDSTPTYDDEEFDPTLVTGGATYGGQPFDQNQVGASPPTYDGQPFDRTKLQPAPPVGETTDMVDCNVTPSTPTVEGVSPTPLDMPAGQLFLGWFVDTVDVIGRRDFLALAPPDAPRVSLVAAGPNTAIDLASDAGKVLQFTLDPNDVVVPAGVDSVLVRLDRQNSPDLLELAATRGADGVWTALLAVDEPDLVAGTWDVQWFGTQSGSGSLLASSVLTVRVQDVVVPKIETSPSTNPVRLGVSQGLAVEVTEAYLRKVTYTFEGLPAPVDLPFPYIIPVTAFPEGPSKLSIRAEDRAGHVAIREVNVERDTVRPAVTILGPANLYAGVPFGLSVAIIERSAHTVRVDIGGTVVDLTGLAGEAAAGKTHILEVTPPAVGELTISAQVTDALGNEAITVREFMAVLPVTDLRVNQVKLGTPATNTANEGQTVVAVLEQVGGVAPLPVTVTFEAAGRSQSFTVTVPASGPFDVRWETKLPPGVTTVKVRATGPAAVDGNASYNETLPGNEEGSATIEAFLGRITVGSTVYSVRADSRGFPTTVVQAGSSKTYPMTLVQTGSGVQYQVTLDGNRTVLWDPLVPIMDLPAAAAPTPDGKDKDAPFPGLLMSLAILALAALAQRRRL